MSAAAKGAAVFLDRDGTLIREVNYLIAIDQIEILPGVTAALRHLAECGFKLVMVTNQSAVARGMLTETGLRQIHAEIVARLAQDGARLDGIYYCPHHPTEGLGEYRIACDCRKPKPGMIERAAADLKIDPARSYMIGDQLTDMELATAVGATGILLDRNDAMSGARLAAGLPMCADLGGAAAWIVERLGKSQEGTQES